MSRVLDQQFVAHIFAPARGPDSAAGFRALEEIWRGCALLLGMTEPIPGISLPHLLSGIKERLPAGGEIALAAQESPGVAGQAVLRLHHDVLNLSIALVPPEASAPPISPPGQEDWPWWRTFDYQPPTSAA